MNLLAVSPKVRGVGWSLRTSMNWKYWSLRGLCTQAGAKRFLVCTLMRMSHLLLRTLPSVRLNRG